MLNIATENSLLLSFQLFYHVLFYIVVFGFIIQKKKKKTYYYNNLELLFLFKFRDLSGGPGGDFGGKLLSTCTL